jgi:hypothetical protein
MDFYTTSSMKPGETVAVGEHTPNSPDAPKVPDLLSVDRETGKVSGLSQQLDGWENRTNPDSVFDQGPDESRERSDRPVTHPYEKLVKHTGVDSFSR